MPISPVFQSIIDTVEPLPDQTYGNRYRCQVTLQDGTHLPCVVVQSRAKLVDLAKRRIQEEILGKGVLGGPDAYGQIVATFAASGNRLADYEVASAAPSRFAIPRDLAMKIHGETWMGWTGWVFEMSNGKMFSYGTSFSFDFFQLPPGYGFGDVRTVHNHSTLDGSKLLGLPRPGDPKRDALTAEWYQAYYKSVQFRELNHFDCYIDGI